MGEEREHVGADGDRRCCVLFEHPILLLGISLVLLAIVIAVIPLTVAIRGDTLGSGLAYGVIRESLADEGAPRSGTQQDAKSTSPVVGTPSAVPSKGDRSERQELFALIERIYKYSAALDYVKWVVPAFGFLFLTGLTTLGVYFVRHQTLVAKNEARDYVQSALSDAKKELGTARSEFDRLAREQERVQSQNVRRAMIKLTNDFCIHCWLTEHRDYGLPIAEKNHSELIKLMEDFKAEGKPSDPNLISIRLNSASNLAYFYAEKHKTGSSGDGTDLVRSSTYAQQFRKYYSEIFCDAEKAMSAISDRQLVGAVDNYLFALSEAGEIPGIESADIEFGKKLLRNWRPRIAEHLRSYLKDNEVDEQLSKYDSTFG